MSKTILVATDGSAQSAKALALGCDLVQRHDGRLCLVHVLLRDKAPRELRRLAVVGRLDAELRGELQQAESRVPDGSVPDWAPVMDPGSVPSPVPKRVLNAIGREILDDALRAAKQQGVDEAAEELEDGNPVKCILAVAKRQAADTIVMGHRGLRDIDALTLGSVSNEVSRLAPCDVVMIK
jgi:nucleotide-binding universal stress UspA family protein